jgi:hypothetical protein
VSATNSVVSVGSDVFSNATFTTSTATLGGDVFGNLTSSGVLNLNKAGTMLVSGNATLNGTTTLAGSGTTGTLQVLGNSVLQSNSVLNMDFTNTSSTSSFGSSDRISTTGMQTYAGTLALNLTNSGTSVTGASWQLFDFGPPTSQNGNLSGVTLAATGPYSGLNFFAASTGNYFDQKYGAGVWLSDWTAGGQRFIFSQSNGQLTVVPEPSTIVFAGIGAAMLGWHTWTRSRRKARMKLIEEHFRRVGEERGLV